MNDKDYERFLAKVDKTDHQRCVDHGCWMWTGGVYQKDGYGQFHLGNRSWGAHRASYEHHKGDVPDGMVVRHQCPYDEGTIDNRRCVNPDHLTVGTHADNLREGYTVNAVNADKPHCPKCEGEYTYLKNGRRYCKSCRNQYNRNYMRHWRSTNKR